MLYDNPELTISSGNITIELGVDPTSLKSLEIIMLSDGIYTSVRVRLKPGMTEFKFTNHMGDECTVHVSGTTMTVYNDMSTGIAQVIGYR